MAPFPPRLPHQPIFYHVLTESYAVEIACDWNTRDAASGFVGYVTRFQIDMELALRYPVQTVGAGRHQELWVRAAELAEFNRHLLGPIEVIATFRATASGVGFPHMLRFDVFGRIIGVERQGGAWRLYRLDSPGGRQQLSNLVIPTDLTEADLARYLADLFRESARPGRADVRRL